MTTAQTLELRTLAVELQSLGVRTTAADHRAGRHARRRGGSLRRRLHLADGAPLTVLVHGDYVASPPTSS